MKTRKNIYFKVVALAVIAIAFAMPAKAQLSDNGYANIDWQFNAPLSNHFEMCIRDSSNTRAICLFSIAANSKFPALSSEHS